MEKTKFYGCKSTEDSYVKIVEDYITSDLNEIEYTAYFGSYDKGFSCFESWKNLITTERLKNRCFYIIINKKLKRRYKFSLKIKFFRCFSSF